MTMTKEEIFRSVRGAFAIGFALPHEDGNLADFEIVHLEAQKNDDVSKLASRIIEAFGCSPEREHSRRARQLSQLISSYVERGLDFVVVISSAHLLNPRTISNLKNIQEFSSLMFLNSHPGFVLLGYPEKLEKSVEKNLGVAMRTPPLPAPQLRLVKW